MKQLITDINYRNIIMNMKIQNHSVIDRKT